MCEFDRDLGRRAADKEKLAEIVELAVNVANDRYWSGNRHNRGLFDQDFNPFWQSI
jgi:hypothetical protein